jgi:hypothetical protein
MRRQRRRDPTTLTEDDLERLHDMAFLFGEQAIQRECGEDWQELVLELRRRGLVLAGRFRLDLTAS